MSKAGTVLKKWHQHYKQDIGAKQGRADANMKFKKAGGAPVIKLASFYIIGNTAGATECYLTGQAAASTRIIVFQTRPLPCLKA